MGFSKMVYIGPYILVKDKTIATEVREKFHPDTGTKYSGEGKFCPHTGKEFEVRTKLVNKSVSFYFIREEPLREDTFFCPEYPNLKGSSVHLVNSRIGTYSNDDTFVYDMVDLDIEDVLSKFRNEYEAYFQYLDDNGWEYSRHYGVIHYAV